MTLPVTDFPAWAATTNYTTGPDVGTATKVAPSAGEIAEGFVPETAAVPQYVNYLFENIKQHITYLRNLAAEAFTWAGVHAFTNTVAFGAAVFTTNEIAYPSPKTRRIMLDAQSFGTEPGGTWSIVPPGIMNSTNFWQAASTVADEIIIGSVRIPNGAIVTGVRVAVLGAIGGNVSFDVYRVRRDRFTGAVSYTQLGATTVFAHTGSLEVLNQTGLISGASGTMTEEDILQISVAAGTLGAPASHLHFAEIEYTELRATGSN